MHHNLFFDSLEGVSFKGTSNSEELESRILGFQNRKLFESLKLAKIQNSKLKTKIAIFEERRDADDALLALINRYWNQHNIEVHSLIEHHSIGGFTDAPREDNALTESLQVFHKKISTLESQELEKDLQMRIVNSKSSTRTILSAFEKLRMRTEKLVDYFNNIKQSDEPQSSMNELSDQLVAQLTKENNYLNMQLTKVKQGNSELSYKLNESDDSLTIANNSNAEMKRKIDELNYELTQKEQYATKLEFSLQQSQQEIDEMSLKTTNDHIIAKGDIQDRKMSVEEVTEIEQLRLEHQNSEHLSQSRLVELETMQKAYEDLAAIVDRSNERVEYPDLSVELSKVRRKLSTAISDLTRVKARLTSANELNYVLQVTIQKIQEDVKEENQISITQATADIARLSEQLGCKEKELELVKLENEQYTIIKAHSNDVHKEMKHLIGSLLIYNKQLKSTNTKYLHKFNRNVKSNENTSAICAGTSLNVVNDLERQLREVTDLERARDLSADFIRKLRDNITNIERQDDSLMQDMEVTGQALEDTQEKNKHLIDKLTSKEQTYISLLSERIKQKHVIEQMVQEKNLSNEQLTIVRSQLDSAGVINTQMQGKENSFTRIISNLENDCKLKEERIELSNRRYSEILQKCDEFKIISDSHYSQLKETQQVLHEKNRLVRNGSFQHRRLEEEIEGLKRKLDKISKLRGMDSDSMLMEEIKELKDRLMCPCCNVHKKNAVLTNCFHVFCLECLTHLYQTRKRKCPKCNASFDINEFKRLWFD